MYASNLIYDCNIDFRIKSMNDADYFLNRAISSEKASIVFCSKDNIYYFLKKENENWYLIPMTDQNTPSLFAARCEITDMKYIIKLVYQNRKQFNEYFF